MQTVRLLIMNKKQDLVCNITQRVGNVINQNNQATKEYMIINEQKNHKIFT